MIGLALAAALIAAMTYAALRRRSPYDELIIELQCDVQALAEALGVTLLPAVERTIAKLEEAIR